MLLQKQSLQELRERFKLNIYEIKIWTSLLGKGIATASDLAEISGVPRSRCYDVLESLEKKGFIIMKIGKPIKYMAVQPEAVVDRVQKKLKEDAEDQIKSVENLAETDIFRELELLHKTGIKRVDVEDVTDYVVGRTNVNRFMKDMLLKAKKSVTVVTNESGIKHKVKILRKVKDNLAKKRVNVKFYTNANVIVDLGNIQILSTKYDARFVNIDNEEIFFVMAGKDPDYDSGVWIKSPHFVNALNTLFQKSLR
jgi:sugar-specific transcriptional regulator TrmB|tara:strand:- start:2937 stop:3695 length:759 start_codon:yes stop_codon:yes gene_type:complete